MKVRGRIRGRGAHAPQRGWALLFTLFAIFAATASIAVVLKGSQTAHATAELDESKKQASYVAEGAIEIARRQLLVAVANFQPAPTQGDLVISGHETSFTITPTGFGAIETQPSGIQTTLVGYAIESVATVGGSTERAQRIVNTESTPLFQFAVFYTNDLEINPGPDMTLAGRVHTNGNMFLGSGNTLTIDTNYCRAAGGIYRHRKDDPSKSNGTVRVRQWVADPFDPSEPSSFVDMNSRSQMSALGVPSTSGYDSNFVDGWDENGDGDFDDPGDWPPWTEGAYEFWSEPLAYGGGTGHTVLSDEHGMSAMEAPGTGSIEMFEDVSASGSGDHAWDAVEEKYVPVAPGTGTHRKGHYHELSGLSVITHRDGSWDAFDGTGASVKGDLEAVDAVEVKSIYDARQGGDVQVVEVDMAALNASGAFPPNGLLYAASYGSGTGTDCKGVKLVNGEELLAPLTVVSENALYVQGDYNTVGKVGAAVIGDAVNLLSNAWDDSKRRGQLPAAEDTTFNLAFVTGNHDTQGSAYNGGLENLPRFHESWSGKACRITGSFVNTWLSNQATGQWKYGGDRYRAPGRLWQYDPDFNNVANLPPFTPQAVMVRDVVTW